MDDYFVIWIDDQINGILAPSLRNLELEGWKFRSFSDLGSAFEFLERGAADLDSCKGAIVDIILPSNRKYESFGSSAGFDLVNPLVTAGISRICFCSVIKSLNVNASIKMLEARYPNINFMNFSKLDFIRGNCVAQLSEFFLLNGDRL